MGVSFLRVLLVAVVTTVMAGGAAARDSIESRPLKFAKGASSATVKGTLQGYQTIDYKLGAKAAQRMSVTLKSPHAGLAFNVLPPGSADVAVADAIERQTWEGALPADGEYTVRMYLPRSAARRNEKTAYTLTVGITGGAAATSAATGGDSLSSAIARAGAGQFNATGKIPCAQNRGQPMGLCDFGVARAGAGTAALSVTMPDGRKRMIFFEKGKATGADLSQADGSTTFRATRKSDLSMIEAGHERYEVPDAAVFGG